MDDKIQEIENAFCWTLNSALEIKQKDRSDRKMYADNAVGMAIALKILKGTATVTDEIVALKKKYGITKMFLEGGKW